jgi:hypothetical protein
MDSPNGAHVDPFSLTPPLALLLLLLLLLLVPLPPQTSTTRLAEAVEALVREFQTSIDAEHDSVFIPHGAYRCPARALGISLRGYYRYA